MISKTFAKLVFIAVSLLSLNAHAAWFYTSGADVPKSGNVGTLNLTRSDNTPFQLNFWDANQVAQIFYSDDANTDVGNQSPANIANVVKNTFNLFDVVEVDKGGVQGNGKVDGLVKSNQGPFEYLAVHIGDDRAILFSFLTGIEEFHLQLITSEKGGKGLADWRAFNGVDAPNPVPLPAAVWLFGSALVSLVGIKRKQA
jgi:hypothetical protein